MTTTPAHLEEVEEAINRHKEILSQALDTVIDQEVSDYPILIWEKETDIEVGVILIQEQKDTGWVIRISTLEELVNKKLLLTEKVEEFRKIFGNAKDQFCVLVLLQNHAEFVFKKRA